MPQLDALDCYLIKNYLIFEGVGEDPYLSVNYLLSVMGWSLDWTGEVVGKLWTGLVEELGGIWGNELLRHIAERIMRTSERVMSDTKNVDKYLQSASGKKHLAKADEAAAVSVLAKSFDPITIMLSTKNAS